MKVLFVFCLAIVLSASIVFAQLPEDFVEGIIELTPDNIEQETANNNILVEFYAPWCSHCQRLAPIYKELGELVAHSSRAKDVKIAKIDASKYKAVIEQYGLKGFPTIKLFVKGKDRPIDQSGDRSVTGFLDFLHKELDQQE